MIKEIVVWGTKIPNLETQQAMRDALKGENLETIEDFFAWVNRFLFF
ncbi:hypothetical protein HpCK98_12190 [Helicobacter pylori]